MPAISAVGCGVGSSLTTATTLAMAGNTQVALILGRGGTCTMYVPGRIWLVRFDSYVVLDFVWRQEGHWSGVFVDWTICSLLQLDKGVQIGDSCASSSIC